MRSRFVNDISNSLGTDYLQYYVINISTANFEVAVSVPILQRLWKSLKLNNSFSRFKRFKDPREANTKGSETFILEGQYTSIYKVNILSQYTIYIIQNHISM